VQGVLAKRHRTTDTPKCRCSRTVRQPEDRCRSAIDRAILPATVADTLVQNGIWEFGRFASRYRHHFGELPSETVRRRAAP